MSNEEDRVFELDKLQSKLRRKSIIDKASLFLEQNNIEKKFTKIFLISEMFVKFPELFTDLSDQFKEVAYKVFIKEDLNINLPLLNTLLIELKKKDLDELNDDLHIMQVRTRASSSETNNENCIRCYETQGKILDVAQLYFEKKNN